MRPASFAMALNKHRPRKRFGQHFLHDPGVIQRILDCIGAGADETIIEIGPGPGVLTESLANNAAQFIAVEIDRDLGAALTERYSSRSNVRIVVADALKQDFSLLARRFRLVGNLPYNISTPLLFHMNQYRSHITDAHFMLQKEVVDRMAAPPGSKTYGRLSVMIQSRWQVESLFRISAGAFNPPPKVESAMVRLTPSVAGDRIADERVFHDLVKAAFAMRRKTLRNTLAGFLSESELSAAGVDPGARAETLSVQDFVELSLQTSYKP